MYAIKEQVARDFELSFWFSQGRRDLQNRLFKSLGREYLNLYSTETLLEFAKRDYRSPQDLTPTFPNGHEKHQPKGVKDELRTAWRQFRSNVIWGRDQDNTLKNYADIASLMIGQDMKFISAGRFALTDSQPDPHASFFRDYILLENPTTSATFDATFLDMRTSVPELMKSNHSLRGDIFGLQVLWQEYHPEDSFNFQI